MVDSGTSMAAGGGFAEDALLSGAGADNGAPADETKGARELAGLVWNYIKTSGDLVEAIDTEVSEGEEGEEGEESENRLDDTCETNENRTN